MKYFNWFNKKAQWSEKNNFKYKKLKIVSSFNEVPENTSEDIYIVRAGDFNKWVMFMCPNQCGERVDVNLMKSRYPKWVLKIKRGKATLYPSVVVETCGAHFWLSANEAEWAFFLDENIRDYSKND